MNTDVDANGDKLDHMVAYEGQPEDVAFEFDFGDPYGTPAYTDIHKFTSDSWILAWEDLYGPYSNTFDVNGKLTYVEGVSSDRDFTDFVVAVTDIQPVPEPATMLLFGTGLAGLAGLRRKKK